MYLSVRVTYLCRWTTSLRLPREFVATMSDRQNDERSPLLQRDSTIQANGGEPEVRFHALTSTVQTQY